MVDSQLVLVSRLPERSRPRAAEFLAELVTLSQAYRHYAAGWISRRELDRRGLFAMRKLSAIRRRPLSETQLTERD